MADRIEAGTLLVAGAITGGDVTVTDCVPEHISAVLMRVPAITLFVAAALWLAGGLPRLDLLHLPLFVVAILLAWTVLFNLHYSFGLLAFWTEETTPFFLIVNRLALVLGGVLAPLEVLPQPIRGIALLLPFSAILYGPARTLVHFQLLPFCWLLLQQVITIAIGSLLLFALYRMATRQVNINGG